MYNRKAFKREAKERMRESTPHYMLVMLVYVLLTTGLTYAVTALTDLGGLIGGTLGMFLNILLSLFTMVLSVGLAHYALNLTRKKPTAVGDLFEGFSFVGRSIGMNILVALYTVLWCMLPVVAFGILIGVIIVLTEEIVVLCILLVTAAYIGLVVALVAIILRYSMAQFALAENPDNGISAAIRRSVQIMRGNKGKLFLLELSFIGWGLLCLLIVLAVMAVGVLVTGVDWFVGMISSVGSDPMDAYNLAMEVTGHLTVWTVIADVLCLPLTLWLTAYQQTAYARFYNYVSGYDYHQYMNEGHEEEPAAAVLPESVPVEPTEPFGGFYTPAPKLDEPVEESVEQPAKETVVELEEIPETSDEEAAVDTEETEEV